MKFNTWLKPFSFDNRTIFYFITNIPSKNAMGRFWGWIANEEGLVKFYSDFEDPINLHIETEESEINLIKKQKIEMIKNIFSVSE